MLGQDLLVQRKVRPVPGDEKNISVGAIPNSWRTRLLSYIIPRIIRSPVDTFSIFMLVVVRRGFIKNLTRYLEPRKLIILRGVLHGLQCLDIERAVPRTNNINIQLPMDLTCN